MIKSINDKTFTEVLDTVYNLGDPKDDGYPINPDYEMVYHRYYELKKHFNGNFDKLVMFALISGLLDTDSDFWKDYCKDTIYQGNNQ